MIVEYSFSVSVTMVAKSDLDVALGHNETNYIENNNSIKCIEYSGPMEDQDRHKPTLIQKAYATSCDLASETAEYLASFSLGQSILRQTDRALWTIEKCAEWSVPSQPQAKHLNHTQNGTFGKTGPLIRPLPWIFFLPMLFILRSLRLCLTIAALLMGFESVKPISMVRFIQVRRRRVRALKFLGLRRIRHRKLSKENALKNTMTIRERFYNIMSRAMCFRVTNSDLYEELTVKKTEEEPQSSSSNVNSNATRQRSVTGRDLKRKYIEILKNNYYDWEDVEDDEELIDRITQLAEDDLEDEDPDFLPAEDSATEEDSMSDAEDDAAVSVVTPPPSQSSPKQIQRLSSHGSIANEIIEEENEEDSESTTVSANSDDESSQHIEKEESPKKVDQDSIKDEKNSVEPSITSDEYYSPMNSISASPEPKIDSEMSKCNNQNKLDSTNKDEKNESINSENQVTVNTKNNQNSLPASPPITNRETNNGGIGKTDANSHSSFSPRMKKHKHRRRFSNLLRRKRK